MGVSQHIHRAMQPARPSLSDALRITDRLEHPAAAKWGGASFHRRIVAPTPERALVSIMWHDGLYYANTVDAFGDVSAGQNWDRLSSAAHRWALKLVDAKKYSSYYFLMTHFSWWMMRSLRGTSR